MPNVTATPRSLRNGEVITEFTDTTSTSAVTYTYPIQQAGISIENSGIADIFVTVGSYTNQVVNPNKTWKTDAVFTSFSIRSNVNSQEFVATAYQNDVEGSGEADSVAREMISSVSTQLAEKTKFDNQADYVDIVKGMKNYSRLRFQKIATNGYLLSVDDGSKHSTYGLIKDTNDDFIKIDDCFVGTLGEAIKSTSNADTRTGTWVTASPPSYYTMEVGATFTCTASGSIIKFRHRRENRGGIWEFVVDGDTANKVSFSTWSAVDSVGGVEDTIFTGLADTTHTVVGTFKGDDPSHLPSSGAGTARGWVNYATTGALIGAIAGFTMDGIVKTKGLLGVGSNKEMAFSIKNGGVSDWVPEHNAVGTAFKIDEPKFLCDGVVQNVSSMAIYQSVTCSKFELVQHLYARINAQNVAEIRITHTIDKSGVFSWSGSITALLDVSMNTMYPLMMPLDQATLTEVLTGIGNSKVSSGDETDYYGFTDEADKLLSCACLSSANKNYVAAGSVQYPVMTMRIGKTGGKPIASQAMRFWQRVTSPKIYWTSGINLSFLTGSAYSWGGKITIAEIENIYYYLKSNV